MSIDDDMKQGLHSLVALLGLDVVLEGLKEEKAAAEQELKRVEAAIKELS